MSLPARVTVVEVGPRDGLQSQGVVLDSAAIVRYVDLLGDSGLPVIEAGAFVSPRWVPEMAGSDTVFRGIRRADGVRYPALVPNERGFDRALEAGVREVAVFTAASETFSRKNTNASIAETIERFRPVARRAAEEGIPVRGYVSTCFGCPFEGPVAPEAVDRVVEQLRDIGIREVSIGDTIGVATPRGVEAVFSRLLKRAEASTLALHAHDTRGTALANCYHALRMGVAVFDTSAGGVGGCPYAPGATGNLATEDLLFMLDDLGVETGVSLEKVAGASEYLESLIGPLPGRAYRAWKSQRGQ